MRNRFLFKSNEISTNSNLTMFPSLSAAPPCRERRPRRSDRRRRSVLPPTMHGGTGDDRKGRPYAKNRRSPDTPGGVSLRRIDNPILYAGITA